MRRSAAAAAGAAGLLAAGTGCAVDTGQVSTLQPFCSSDSVLVLEAQSVPTADRVPCVTALPAGWSIGDIEVRDSRTRFGLSSDRAGIRALDVTLSRTCDVRGATEIASDEPGTRRYERVRSVIGGFDGERYYVFPGGCTTYRFRLAAPGQDLLNDASVALTFLPRAELADRVRASTHGRERLAGRAPAARV